MYIEFQLPDDESYGLVLGMLKLDIVDWATQYNIPYTQKTVKYTHRLAFDKEQHYSLFSMTWKNLEYKMINVGVQKY